MTEQNEETTEITEDVAETTDTAEPATGADSPPDEPETFPREYVVKLRQESAQYRTRAQQADDLAARLHTSLVAATGRLADPSDLTFDEAYLDDETALTTAIDELLARKPHLGSRRPVGEVGQGASPPGDTVNLAGILRSRAG